MIPFNVPPVVGNEIEYVRQAIDNHKICGDGEFTKRCTDWLEQNLGAQKVLLTTSGTSALEMAALLCDLKPGDEVILPSFTFSSTATAFVLAGARLVFVDIRPDTMNIDESKIEGAITDRTRVICVMHYAGVACEMDEIMSIARNHNLLVVEDAAQAALATYKGKALGTFGDFGCLSFHEAKNFSMGEGGALIINNAKFNDRAEILREKGTNRAQFFRGQVAKYNWVSFGSSYLPSDMLAAYLWAQLENSQAILKNRMTIWQRYKASLESLIENSAFEVQSIPEYCQHNAHMFYIKCKDVDQRSDFIRFMKQNDILCCFHYVPLHSAPAGVKYGRFNGIDEYTTKESDRLVRLPLFYQLSLSDQEMVIEKVKQFFDRREDLS